MLPKANRLAKRTDIERVFKRGKTFFVGNLSIRTAANNLAVSRFTVVVSTKISKKATRRNRLKRLIREAIRREALPKTKPGYDGIIMTQKGAMEKNYNEITKLVVGLFKKAKITQDDR